jgi:hypothetical protein
VRILQNCRVLAHYDVPNLAVSLHRWQNSDKPILIAAKCIGRKLVFGFRRTDWRTNWHRGERP